MMPLKKKSNRNLSLVPYVVLLKIKKDYIVIQVLGSIRSEKVCRGSKGARVQWVEHKTFTHNISMSFLCRARISFVLFVLSLFTCLSDGRGLDEGGGAAGSQISAFNFRTTPKLRKAKSKPSYLSSCNQQMFKFIHYASKVSVIHTHCKKLWLLPFRSQRSTTPRWYWGLWWTIWPVR